MALICSEYPGRGFGRGERKEAPALSRSLRPNFWLTVVPPAPSYNNSHTPMWPSVPASFGGALESATSRLEYQWHRTRRTNPDSQSSGSASQEIQTNQDLP